MRFLRKRLTEPTAFAAALQGKLGEAARKADQASSLQKKS
jgi:hypothetical protein